MTAPLPGSSGQLSHFMAGIYPLCSFLHVPGKMSRPAWLSLGTAFLVEPPTPQFDERTRGMALLTAAHTVLPWAYLDEKASKELKLPEEFRKSRYVVGRVYLPDPNGNALKGSWFPVKLSALHPTLDVGLLSMGTHDEAVPKPSSSSSSGNPSAAPKRPSSLTLSEASLVQADRFRDALAKRHLLKRFRLSSRNLSLPSTTSSYDAASVESGGGLSSSTLSLPSEGLQTYEHELNAVKSAMLEASASVASIVGFRAKGLLGTMNTMDPRALDALEPSVKAKLMAEMADIEGRQEAATLGLRAVEGGQHRYFIMNTTTSDSSPSLSSSSSLSSPLSLPKSLASDESLPLITPEGNQTTSSTASCKNTVNLRCASIGLVSQGYGYHGMSGSPVVVGKWAAGATLSLSSETSPTAPPAEWCCGVLHGASSDPNTLMGTIPSSSSGLGSASSSSAAVARGRATPIGRVDSDKYKAENGENGVPSLSDDENKPSSTSPPSFLLSPSVAEMVAASSSPTPFVSYIPSDVVLDWCIRDLSGIRDEEEVRRIKLAHDPLRELVVKEEELVRRIKSLNRDTTANSSSHIMEEGQQAAATSVASPSSSLRHSDPVTDEMMTPDDEDLAFIAKIRREKLERDAKRQK